MNLDYIIRKLYLVNYTTSYFTGRYDVFQNLKSSVLTEDNWLPMKQHQASLDFP